MATPTSNLRLRKQATGDNNNTWGDILNVTLDNIDSAISGVTSIATTGGTYTLSVTDYVADEARQPVIFITGTLVMDATIVIPQGTRKLMVVNATSGAFNVIITTGTGTPYTVAQNSRILLLINGANVEAGSSAVDAAGNPVGSPTLSALGVTGALSAGSVTATGPLAGATLLITGDASVGGDLAAGNIGATGDIDSGGSGTYAGNLDVGGVITSVGGIGTNGDIGAGGNITGVNIGATGDLAVDGAAHVDGNITTNGEITATGAITSGGAGTFNSLAVTNDAAVGGNLTATGNLTAATLTTTGNADVGGNLNVVGSTTLANPTIINGVTYNWPAADGTAGQALLTNADGTIAWGNVGVGNFQTDGSTAMTGNMNLGGNSLTNVDNITATGLATLATVDIGAGAIDGTVIGAAAAAAGTFTDLISTGNTTLGNAATDTLTVTATATFAEEVTLAGDPVTALGAVPKQYVDNALLGLGWKQPARVATTADIALVGLQTIDGVVLAVGDRVLVKDQATATENGIYVAAAGAWPRAQDANDDADLKSAAILVEEGTVGADKFYTQTADAVAIGVTNLSFAAFSGSATGGLSLTGGTMTGSLNMGGNNLTNIGTLGTVATVDIDGGAIDGTVIGGTTPAAGTFSDLLAAARDAVDAGGLVTLAGAGANSDIEISNEAGELQIAGAGTGDWVFGAAGEITHDGDRVNQKGGVGAAPPTVGNVYGDTFYRTTDDVLAMWTNDGASDFWMQIN